MKRTVPADVVSAAFLGFHVGRLMFLAEALARITLDDKDVGKMKRSAAEGMLEAIAEIKSLKPPARKKGKA